MVDEEEPVLLFHPCFICIKGKMATLFSSKHNHHFERVIKVLRYLLFHWVKKSLICHEYLSEQKINLRRPSTPCCQILYVVISDATLYFGI